MRQIAFAYCDDIKPDVTKKSESFLVEKAASVCMFHIIPRSDKCKINFFFRKEDLHWNKKYPSGFLQNTFPSRHFLNQYFAKYHKTRSKN